jgi:hypothetical protein
VHRRLLPGGMVKLELVLQPDEADLLLVERAREVQAAQDEQAAAAGVSAETCRGALRLAESFLAGQERFQVMRHLGQEPLAADGMLAATLEDGTSVSAETLRRVACDCGLLAANAGRRTRSIPPMVRDPGCAFPGCLHTRFLHGHHIEHWLHGGQTRLDNLVTLCSFHHRLVHEGGWTIATGADGAFSFHSPSGQPLAQNPPRERVDDVLGWMREWAQGRDLRPDVNMPAWEGTKPDYDLAVSGLLATT